MPSPLYYGTQDHLTSKESFHFKKYCKRTNFYSIEAFQIDPAIFTLMNLDCTHCHEVHPSTCCEGGQPYSTDPSGEDRLSQHAPMIIQHYLDQEQQQEFHTAGFMESSTDGVFSPTIKLCQGNCFFLKKEQGSSYCSIHRYALAQQLNPWDIKPFSCSLFPLDIIYDQDKLYLTVITEQTASFSRWGYDYQDYLCVNKRLREVTPLAPELFSLTNYRPAWEWCEELLRLTFGNGLVEGILHMREMVST